MACEVAHIAFARNCPTSTWLVTRGGFVKLLIVCGLIALVAHPASAVELKVGDRIPARSGEALVLANDGGVERGAQVLAFGSVCRVSGWTRDWFLVKRIVGAWTLIELVGPSAADDPIVDNPSFLAPECPLGTETSRPIGEMTERLNRYANDTDAELLLSLMQARAKRR